MSSRSRHSSQSSRSSRSHREPSIYSSGSGRSSRQEPDRAPSVYSMASMQSSLSQATSSGRSTAQSTSHLTSISRRSHHSQHSRSSSSSHRSCESRSTLTPRTTRRSIFDRLPNEIMQEVFAYVGADDKHALTLVGKVCSRWRANMLPLLYRDVIVVFGGTRKEIHFMEERFKQNPRKHLPATTYVIPKGDDVFEYFDNWKGKLESLGNDSYFKIGRDKAATALSHSHSHFGQMFQFVRNLHIINQGVEYTSSIPGHMSNMIGFLKQGRRVMPRLNHVRLTNDYQARFAGVKTNNPFTQADLAPMDVFNTLAQYAASSSFRAYGLYEWLGFQKMYGNGSGKCPLSARVDLRPQDAVEVGLRMQLPSSTVSFMFRDYYLANRQMFHHEELEALFARCANLKELYMRFIDSIELVDILPKTIEKLTIIDDDDLDGEDLREHCKALIYPNAKHVHFDCMVYLVPVFCRFPNLESVTLGKIMQDVRVVYENLKPAFAQCTRLHTVRLESLMWLYAKKDLFPKHTIRVLEVDELLNLSLIMDRYEEWDKMPHTSVCSNFVKNQQRLQVVRIGPTLLKFVNHQQKFDKFVKMFWKHTNARVYIPGKEGWTLVKST